MSSENDNSGRAKFLEKFKDIELPVCRHCGRCLLAGGYCCKGMKEDCDAAKAQRAAERKEAKRQRRLARRAARRETNKQEGEKQ